MHRPTPWYRLRNVVVAILLLVVAWLGVEVWRAMTAAPGREIDYAAQINELVVARQPGTAGAPNGWDDWMAAAFIMRSLGDELEDEVGARPSNVTVRLGWPYDFDEVLNSEAPASVRENTLALMERMDGAGVNDLLARAADNERSFYTVPDEAPLAAVLLPEIGELRTLARYQRARALLAARRGDWDEFALAVDQMLHSAHMCTQQPFLVFTSAGLRLYREAAETMQLGLAAGEPPAEVFPLLRESIDDTPPETLELALETHRLMSLDYIQWTHTGGGRLILTATETLGGASAGPLGSLPNHEAVNLLGIVFPSKKQSEAKFNDLFGSAEEWAGLPPLERRMMELEPWAQNLGFGYVVVRSLDPGMPVAAQMRDEALTGREQMRITIALERFRADHGAYPVTLAELVPTYLPEPPVDPVTRTGFHYKRREDVETGGVPYRLVPIGLDGADDEPADSSRP